MSGQEYINDDWTERVAVDYTYDELGNRTDRDNGLTLNDVLTDYVYNDRGELMSIDHEGLYEMSYMHDGGGNPMAIAFSGTNCPAVLDDKTVTYTYDAISRLTNETIPSTSNTTWAYDWVGNRNPATYTYNKVDELTDTDGQAGVEYTYDKLGNLLYKPNLQNWEVQYIYRGDNLLSDIYYLEGGNTCGVYMTWDADGHRVYVNQDFVEEWTFMYDPTAGIPAVLFTEHLAETNDYTYNVREPGGALLASFEPDGENLHYYHFDALGSTVLVTNGSGTVSDAYAYDAWGNALSGGDGLKPYQYVGQLGYYSHTSAQGDALEDLMQLGVRFYDPVTGRFTQLDPAKSGLSGYMYASNNPTRGVDPSGLYTTKNCNKDKKTIIEDAIRKIDRLLDDSKTTCLDDEDKARLRKKLHPDPDSIPALTPIEIQCGGASCNSQKYGYHRPYFEPNTIHLCEAAFSGVPCHHTVSWLANGLGVLGVAAYVGSTTAPEQQPGVPFTTLHELLHAIGYDEAEARRKADKCFPGNLPK